MPDSSIPMLRAFTFEGGGQGGGWVPRTDPADGQVTLHAAPLIQHAGVHGRAWGKETGTAAHQPALAQSPGPGRGRWVAGKFVLIVTSAVTAWVCPDGPWMSQHQKGERTKAFSFPVLHEELKLPPWKCHKLPPSPRGGASFSPCKPRLARVVLGSLQYPSRLQL